jgi:hypothetical protein
MRHTTIRVTSSHAKAAFAFGGQRFRAGTPSDKPVFLARRERIALGMRKAGMPEH